MIIRMNKNERLNL